MPSLLSLYFVLPAVKNPQFELNQIVFYIFRKPRLKHFYNAFFPLLIARKRIYIIFKIIYSVLNKSIHRLYVKENLLDGQVTLCQCCIIPHQTIANQKPTYQSMDKQFWELPKNSGASKKVVGVECLLRGLAT